ncbi:hypothetical protein FPV13_14545 (plasmid) [Mammaliicoccus sciuri]|uniref:Uncharacterized protein n=1 Tax=Mammaliicoccus sciuri TaxID=1296 RepID=A0A517CM68_MAMSC|nr:hypothetical protein [Mammaliicoccus sciuri]QDR66116.1 hypothetical protein FPV13_14545 [Mammaliicoccus sciuri]
MVRVKSKKIFSYFAVIICRQAKEYKEYIQHSQFSDRDTVSNNQLEAIGPVPAWLNRSNRESFTMYNK